jgi:hypothetical protein
LFLSHKKDTIRAMQILSNTVFSPLLSYGGQVL